MADKRGNIVNRFGIVYVLVVCAFVMIAVKTVYVQTVERKPLLALAAKVQNTNDTTELEYSRGNIYDCNGRLLSSSIPSYIIRMDTKVPGLKDTSDIISRKNRRDTVVVFKQNGRTVNRFNAKLDSTAEALSLLFYRDRSKKQEYKSVMSRGYARGDRALLLYPKKISYIQWREVQKMPLFRYARNGINLGGLYCEERIGRERPFGSLAARTLGSIWSENQYKTDPKTKKYILDTKTEEKILEYKAGSGRNGLEMFFNTVLTGKNGIAVRRKNANKRNVRIPISEAVAGNDIVTTIDVDIQDLAESALRENLDSLNAQSACAIVMTTDGEIRACVNLFKTANGYDEIDDMAIQGRFETGSTFKTASMMIALENGFVKANDTVNTAVSKYGVDDLHSYPKLTAAEIIERSNNIGISNIITEHYAGNPQKFIDDIYRLQILDSIRIQIPYALSPLVYRNRTASKNVQISNIARISFGHSISVPPIYMLRFYNAIANGGQMVEPRFVKSIRSGQKDIEIFDKEIINPKICSENTLKIIQTMLEGAINNKYGTGYKDVRSNFVKIAGKTGTADIENNTKNYASFCGYFPADNPKYTCIVAMVVPHRTYGADASGRVFKKIAEGISSMRLNTTPQIFAADSTFNLFNIKKMPYIKDGNFVQFQTVVNGLKFSVTGNGSEWVTATADSNSIAIKPLVISAGTVPNVCGMGAKDAVYLMERAGLRVHIAGYGKVVSQTIPSGTPVARGATVLLKMEFQQET